METPLRDNSGVALLLTILIVSLIVALTLEFNRTMRTHMESAGSIGHGLRALYTAKSGVSCALAMLKADPTQESDTLLDEWALVENLTLVSAGSQALFAGGRFELQIEDLAGRIQINRLDKLEKVFRAFLELEEFGLDEDRDRIIADCVMDWIDKDEDLDLAREFGEEDDYYMSLERPYHCRNGPLDSPEELLLVKGVTPELFYGTEDHPGIAPYITVFGDGEININTADPESPGAPPLVLRSILMSIHDDDPETKAENLATYRSDADEEDLKAQRWYRQAPACADLKIPPGIIKIKSSHFQITSVGHFGDITRRVEAVVERTDDDFQILSWKIE